jgi:hypothetical protein
MFSCPKQLVASEFMAMAHGYQQQCPAVQPVSENSDPVTAR